MIMIACQVSRNPKQSHHEEYKLSFYSLNVAYSMFVALHAALTGQSFMVLQELER